MRMKASEVGNRLRLIAGKRDYRKALSDSDNLALRPGPNQDCPQGTTLAFGNTDIYGGSYTNP